MTNFEYLQRIVNEKKTLLAEIVTLQELNRFTDLSDATERYISLTYEVLSFSMAIKSGTVDKHAAYLDSPVELYQ